MCTHSSSLHKLLCIYLKLVIFGQYSKHFMFMQLVQSYQVKYSSGLDVFVLHECDEDDDDVCPGQIE